MDIPEKIEEIVKLSDEQFPEHESFENDDAPLKRGFSGDLFAADPVREALVERLKELSDEEFLCLHNLVDFGREYSPSNGCPQKALQKYLKGKFHESRDTEESILADKPIGQFLRAAVEHLRYDPDEETRLAWAEQDLQEELERELQEKYLSEEGSDEL
jgi:hypothetical protein